MNKKISGYIILLVAILILILSFRSCKEFVYVGLGNYFTNKVSYDNGESFYQKVLATSKNKDKILSNIIKNNYAKKNYMKIVSTETSENFINGNSEVKFNEGLEAGIEDFNNDGGDLYEKALENYKLALKTSDDINIKKNYEIVLQKQKSQDKKDKKNKQNQNKDQQKNQDKNQNKNQNKNQDKNQDKNNQDQKNQQQQNQDNKQDPNNNDEKNKNNQKNQQQQNQPQNNDGEQKPPLEQSKAPSAKEQKEADQKKEEMNFVLKQLEGKEAKSFKENLKVQVINKSVPKDSNQW
ncbi:MAG: hypothetical protein ACRCSK_02580 [Fusobacteriaceae bacterium]